MTGARGGQLPPDVVPFGDAALLVVFGEVVDLGLSRRAQALARAVEAERAGGAFGWGAPVPAYASVLVPFDPVVVPLIVARTRLAAIAAQLPDLAVEPEDGEASIVIDVRYGGDDGPDLDEVARRIGRSPADVTAMHAGTTYQVYFLGFAPGFGYLGPLPEPLRLPRRDTPRVRVAAGSVAIAGAQTAVYPRESPGGWHLIGRTDLALWDPGRDEPALLRAGRSVRFRPVETSPSR